MKTVTRRRGASAPATTLAVSLLALIATGAGAQPVPLSDEFVVNTYTTGSQSGPSVAHDDAGNFIVVWRHGDTATGLSVRGRRYDDTGLPIGSEFEVTSYTSQRPTDPYVAMAADGNFMVVWRESEPRIVARAFDDQGVPTGTDFRVDSIIYPDAGGYYQAYDDRKEDPAIAAGGDGRFMIVWSGGYTLYQYHLHTARRISGQVVDSAGTFVGTEFAIGGDLYYQVLKPQVRGNSAGQFVVVWNDLTDYDYPEPCCYYRDPNFSIRARRFDSDGASTSGALTVGAAQDRVAPGIDLNSSGQFIVAWALGESSYGYEMRAQRYDGSAAPVGGPIAVSDTPGEGESSDSGAGGSTVAVNSAGQFAVVWSQGGAGYDSPGDGDGAGIFARVYAADGTPQGPAVVVNAFTSGAQAKPAVTFTGDDEFVVTWNSADRDGSGTGVAARRFVRAPACGDAGADGVITATDALIALTAAVGTANCTLCVCDADASGTISATDALLILNDSVGNPVTLGCIAC